MGEAAGKIVAVVGMVREAKIIAGDGVVTAIGGGDAANLARGIEAALNGGAVGVLSFGLCGGLSPALNVGDCIVASEIVTPQRRIVADDTWATRLGQALPGSLRARLAAGGEIVSDADAKTTLYTRTGAAGVDMESHIAAEIAERFKVPFAAMRAVSDPSDRALPKAAQAGFGAGGKPDIGAVLRALMADPGQLPALIRTAREAEIGFRILQHRALQLRQAKALFYSTAQSG